MADQDQDENPKAAPAPPAPAPKPAAMAKVQCITDLQPWASVDGKQPRPLDNDEVALIPRREAEIMKRNRHVVEIA